MTACKFAPCPEDARVKGYCQRHYLQSYHGRPLGMPKPRGRSAARDENGNKRCCSCETWRPEADFASSFGKGDGLQPRCRECNAIIYAGRREAVRDQMRERRFGITREEFNRLFESQGNRCAICQGTDSGGPFWSIDHDHSCCAEAGTSCGKCIRGILCARCNHGLGHFRDDPTRLLAAVAYLSTR